MRLYGCEWKTDQQIEIELYAIAAGGYWTHNGTRHGRGLFHHHKALQSIYAPWKKWDRWSELILENLIENRLTVLTGPASSTKTHNVAAFALDLYLARPTNQCVLVSSTDSRSLELRIWGEIKKLWSAVRGIWEDCPGRIIESRQMIVTDIEDEAATDYRNGIIAIPCIQGGSFVGLGKFCGIKNGNVFLAADELQFLSLAFFDGVSNLANNPQFSCAGMGNPKDRTDVLGKFAEPATELGGWEKYEPTGKTFTYRTRFKGGRAIVLDGRDTPNNDRDPGAPVPYPYIITPENIATAVEYYGEESVQVSMMYYGIFPVDAQAKRVINRSLCERFRAFEEVTWTHEGFKKVLGLDAAYGSVGGDRCVAVELHFGKCSDGLTRIAFAGPPQIIPVKGNTGVLPEDQIATWVMDYCMARGIPAGHVGLDSTGRGTLVSAFGRIWKLPDGSTPGTQVHAIEFGGKATDRMVSAKIQQKCSDYFLNFMSELWYQSRHVIESDQLRKLPVQVMDEGCMRAWEMTKGNRIQVEPKEKTKERMARSPDLYDAFVTGIEVARRLGFSIAGGVAGGATKAPNWLLDLARKQKEMQKRHQLTYASKA